MAARLNSDPQAPGYWQEACRALSGVHPVWHQLIRDYPDRALRSRGAPFETLLRSVVGQQISVKAADAVWGRFCALVDLPFSSPGCSQVLLNLDEESLRAVGLSRQKVTYLRALADFEQSGGLELAYLQSLDDTECIRHLVQIKGIGAWTAQMFLMFCLRRPDVWPIDDIGVQKAISKQFFEGQTIGPREALQFGETCRPWRTVAAWYLWRSLDPAVVDY